MIVSEAIASVRRVLADPVNAITNPVQKWTDADLAAIILEQVRALVRIQAQRGKGFHNCSIVLDPEAGTGKAALPVQQVATAVWQYALPPWTMQVAGVWICSSDIADGESMFLLALQNPPIVGAELPRWNRTARHQGWSFDDRRSIRVHGFSAAPTLVLNIAKLPPRMISGTVDLQLIDPDRRRFYLPQVFTLGSEDTIHGAFANLDLQFTSSSAAEQIGWVARVVESVTNYGSSSGIRRHALRLDGEIPGPGYIPLAAKFESILQVNEEHTRLVVLRTANAAFQRYNNVPGQRAIGPELAEQQAAFIEYATAQDTPAGPYYWQSPETHAIADPDRAQRIYPTH